MRPVRTAGRPLSGEEGVGTVLAAVVSLGVIALLWFGMQLGAATISRHRVEGAADLAALAAAASAPRGDASACARAKRVARAMSGAVVACHLDGLESRVRVRMELPGIVSRLSTVEAVTGRARAGPVSGEDLPAV